MFKVRNISCFHNVDFSQPILLLSAVQFSQLFGSASIINVTIVEIPKNL